MKKLTPEYKRFLQAKAEKQVKENVKEARILYKKRIRKKLNLVADRQKSWIRISAPEKFLLGYTSGDVKIGYPQTRNKLLGFIERIKRSLNKNRKVHISFKNTKTLDPSGTLIFVAELQGILDKHPGKVTIDYPDDDVVEQLFQHIGLLKRLGMTSRKSITAENVRHWDYVYGTSADASKFKRLFSRYTASLSEEVRSGLFASMSEAVTNSIQHAYPCEHKDDCGCKKGWWMFASQANSNLTVVIYDMGIGIPASLQQRPDMMEFFLSAPFAKFRHSPETQLIEIAVQSRRTSTRMPHRGKGLPEMLEFVRGCDIGGFKIYSHAGSFYYGAEERIERGRDFGIPITGTIVQWEIPLTV